MFCENCGSQMVDGSKFCAKCGFKMEDGAPVPEKAATKKAAPVAPAAPKAAPAPAPTPAPNVVQTAPQANLRPPMEKKHKKVFIMAIISGAFGLISIIGGLVGLLWFNGSLTLGVTPWLDVMQSSKYTAQVAIQLKEVLGQFCAMVIMVGFITLIPSALKVTACVFGFIYARSQKFYKLSYYLSMVAVAFDGVSLMNSLTITAIIASICGMANSFLTGMISSIPSEFVVYLSYPNIISGWLVGNLMLITLPAFAASLLYFIFLVKSKED